MFKNYYKIALRSILKKKMFSFINISGLALGMAACLSIFYYVSYEFSYEEFFPESENIYRVYFEREQETGTTIYFYPGTALQPMLMEQPVVDDAFRLVNIDYQNNSLVYQKNGNVQTFEQSGVYFCDGNVESTLGLQMISGSCAKMNEPMKVVLPEKLVSKFIDPDQAIGQTITLRSNIGDRDFEIVGVFKDLPSNTDFDLNVLLSMSTYDVIQGAGATNSWENWNTSTYLKSAKPIHEIRTAINLFIENDPNFNDEANTWRLNLLPLEDLHLNILQEDNTITNTAEQTLYGLALIGIFILCIAWINFINLSTARAMERAREVGVRKVLGSLTYQLRIQFIIESFIINILAAILAFTVVQVSLPYLSSLTNPMQIAPSHSWFFWSGTASLLIVGSLLSGLYPAFVLSGFNPTSVLKGKISSFGKGALLRKGLVVFQFIASTLMITGTYVIYQQIVFMKNQDLGVNIDNVLLLDSPPNNISAQDNEMRNAINSFKEEVVGLNSVNYMTASSFTPGQPIGWNTIIRKATSNDEDRKNIMLIACDRDFVNAYDLELVAGHFYRDGESTFTRGDFVINEKALDLFGFSSAEEAIGEKLVEGRMFPDLTVVGVVKDFHQQSLKNRIEPCGFVLSSWSNYYSLSLNVDESLPANQRAENLKSTLVEIEGIWNKFFPEAPFDYNFLDQQFDAQYKSDSEFGTIISFFAVMSMAIAGLGLFGLSSYSVIQKTKEIGIRKVLGASTARLYLLLSNEYLILIAISVVVALPLGLMSMTQWLESYPYRIAMQWWMFALPVLLILVIAALTVGYQVLKATLKNPVESLRYE
ncbi:MAG: FtsX-like permease family protein [Bacteroidota bacterium]